jgi:hypothetical protein
MLVAALLVLELLFQSFNFTSSKYLFVYRVLLEGETMNFQQQHCQSKKRTSIT